MPEVLSWEVSGETVLEPAPSFPRAQVPGGRRALCSPVPSPRRVKEREAGGWQRAGAVTLQRAAGRGR